MSLSVGLWSWPKRFDAVYSNIPSRKPAKKPLKLVYIRREFSNLISLQRSLDILSLRQNLDISSTYDNYLTLDYLRRLLVLSYLQRLPGIQVPAKLSSPLEKGRCTSQLLSLVVSRCH